MCRSLTSRFRRVALQLDRVLCRANIGGGWATKSFQDTIERSVQWAVISLSHRPGWWAGPTRLRLPGRNVRGRCAGALRFTGMKSSNSQPSGVLRDQLHPVGRHRDRAGGPPCSPPAAYVKAGGAWAHDVFSIRTTSIFDTIVAQGSNTANAGPPAADLNGRSSAATGRPFWNTTNGFRDVPRDVHAGLGATYPLESDKT